MTVRIKSSGASSASPKSWETIEWKTAIRYVYRLQMRIAKAYREGKHGKVKSLQWLLTHSFYAKALAVKRVVQNKGSKTSGVDNIVWKTSNQKWRAIQSLKRRGYQPQPLRRIYIAKKQKGKLRPLSIPTMHCRAQQALHLFALEPIAELQADKNTYGFRPLRSTADAIEQCFNILVQPTAAAYILEGDIKSCFDSISHTWLMQNVTMDKQILKKWLDAGYLEKDKFHSMMSGTPQGGIISPTLLNITLSGLEELLAKAAPNPKDRVHLCAYADDFIITGATKAVLEEKIKPVVEKFLAERGLSLSPEKTKITHIEKGFDFLGITIRKYNGKLIMAPAKSSVTRLLDGIREIIKRHRADRIENLITNLNDKIRGWSNYYRHVCSKKTFSNIDHAIFHLLKKWCRRRHSSKSLTWIKAKYYRRDMFRDWIFTTVIKDKQGNALYLDLLSASRVTIKRHIKIIAKATPYDPQYQAYFKDRISSLSQGRYIKRRLSKWSTCWEFLERNKAMEKLGCISSLHKGLSVVRRKSQAAFLGERQLVTAAAYPTRAICTFVVKILR